MNREFTLIKDYYDDGIDIYKKKTILIKPGVTVLAGCNGIGKSTLLRQIKNILKKNNIPCIKYDNLTEGGEEARSKAGFFGDFQFLATASQSSEGENIIMNMSNLARDIGDFVRSGKNSEEEKFDRISRVILTSNNKPPKYDFYVPIIERVIKDYLDDSRIDLLSKEIKEHSNYDGTPLRNPNIFKVLEITKKWLEIICLDISNGKNTFKDNYETILNEFKEL